MENKKTKSDTLELVNFLKWKHSFDTDILISLLSKQPDVMVIGMTDEKEHKFLGHVIFAIEK